MRVVFIGTSAEALMTARLLVGRNHEVIVVEKDKDRIEEFGEKLDCAFLHGDGTVPSVLKEVDPEACDFLFCITEHDQTNIIASLVGKSLGFNRVVTAITDEGYEPVCKELGIDSIILPSRTIGRYLADLLSGVDVLELGTAIKGEARLFSFIATDNDLVKVQDLEIPDNSKVGWLYRDGDFMFADDSFSLKKRDEVVLITHSKNLKELEKRWAKEG